MRRPILAVAVLLALFAIPLVPAGGHVVAVATTISGVVLHAQEAPTPSARVDINVNHGGRGWYANPMWIAIGAIALILVIMLIVMASRGGGGTTVVR